MNVEVPVDQLVALEALDYFGGVLVVPIRGEVHVARVVQAWALPGFVLGD